MAYYSNTLEGTATATVDATSSLSGGDPVTVFNTGGGVCVYDTTHPAHGTTSAKFTVVSGGTNQGLLPNVAATSYAWHGTGRIDAYASGGDIRPLQVGVGSGAMKLIIRSTGLTVRNGNGVDIWVSPSNAAWPINTPVRVETFLDVTTGAAQFATYNGDGSTALWSQSMSSGWPMGSGVTSITRTYFGLGGSNPATIWWSGVAQNDAATGFIGVAADAPDGSVAVLDNLARITATGSGGAGGYSYSISQTSGPPTSPSLVDDGVWVVPKPTTGTLTYQVIITDSSDVESDPITVNVQPIPSGAAGWPKRPTGTLPSSTWS